MLLFTQMCIRDSIYTLETTGFKARGFGNGNELMKALKEEIPELILLDSMLPGDDGYTILEQLKSMPSVKLSLIHILFFT